MSHFQIPNGLGALSGMAQLHLYFIYRNAPPIVAEHPELNEAGTPTETQLWKDGHSSEDVLVVNPLTGDQKILGVPTLENGAPVDHIVQHLNLWDVHIQSASNLPDLDDLRSIDHS